MPKVSDDRVRGMVMREIAPLMLGLAGEATLAQSLEAGSPHVDQAEAMRGATALRDVQARSPDILGARVLRECERSLIAVDPRPAMRQAAEELGEAFAIWFWATSARNIARGVKGDGDTLLETAKLIWEIRTRSTML